MWQCVSALYLSLSHMTREKIIACNHYISGWAYCESEAGPTFTSYFKSSEPCVGAISHQTPFREPLFGKSLFSYEITLGVTLALPLLCSEKQPFIRRRFSFGTPPLPSRSWFPYQGFDSTLVRLISLVAFPSTLFHWLEEDTLDTSRRSTYLHNTF